MELVSLEAFASIYEDAEVVGRRVHGVMDVIELAHPERGVLVAVIGGDGVVLVPRGAR